MGAGGAYRPDPDAPWHLLIADHTAIPAVSSALEEMDAAATGHIIANVPTPRTVCRPKFPQG